MIIEPLALTTVVSGLTVWSIKLWLTNKKPSLLFVGTLLSLATTLISPYQPLIDNYLVANDNLSVKIAEEAIVPKIEVAFSPNQGATELILDKINLAQKSIKVAAYSFTAQAIADALVAARKRGVDVQVVLDRKQATDKYSVFNYLQRHNIQTRINSAYAIMHNKFMIIDDKTLQLGSFNYSKSAEKKNAENVLAITHEAKVIKAYVQQWRKLWDESL